MAAITPTNDTGDTYKGPSRVRRSYGTGTANQSDTLTSPAQALVTYLRYVTVSYSAAPTQTGVTIEIDSGAGAGYDSTLFTGVANARYTVYYPDHATPLMVGDAIKVTAPAAGGSITASVVIVTEIE